MPSTYAHYRFGVHILPTLPADVRRPIERYRTLFDLGLQGPDFFYFYKPLRKTDTGALGDLFHAQTGREFFDRVCRELPSPTEAELAYLYGLLGHYCLDSVCHPFVHGHTNEGSISHSELESEFERYLLALDGLKKPHAYDRSVHLTLPKGDCATVAKFYPSVTTDQIHRSFNTMARILKLLTGNSSVKRAVISRALRLACPEKAGLLMHKEPNPSCAGLNEPLLTLYDAALEHYPELLEDLRDHMTYNAPLGEEFNLIFG